MRCPFCGSSNLLWSPPYVSCRECRRWWDQDEVAEEEENDG